MKNKTRFFLIATVVLTTGCGATTDMAFYKALDNKDTVKASSLVESMKVEEINKLDKEHQDKSPLIEAVRSNNINLTELLIKKGADINIANRWGYTPLHLAVIKNNNDIVRLLLQNGADLESKDKEGLTPIYYSIKSNRLDPVSKELLLINIKNFSNLHANLHYNIRDSISYMIINSIIQGKLSTTKLLHKHGSDIEAPSNSFHSPLMYSLEKNFPIHAIYLIQNGANVNITTSYGRTPLGFAIKSEYPYLALLLMEYGSIPQKDHLYLACSRFEDELNAVFSPQNPHSIVLLKVIEEIILRGVPDKRGKAFKIFINRDLAKKMPEKAFNLARLSVTNGLAMDSTDCFYDACWECAVHKGNEQHNEWLDLVRFMLEKGANPDTRHSSYDPMEPLYGKKSVLVMAINKGDSALVKLLLDFGAKLDIKNMQRMTDWLNDAQIEKLKSSLIELDPRLKIW